MPSLSSRHSSPLHPPTIHPSLFAPMPLSKPLSCPPSSFTGEREVVGDPPAGGVGVGVDGDCIIKATTATATKSTAMPTEIIGRVEVFLPFVDFFFDILLLYATIIAMALIIKHYTKTVTIIVLALSIAGYPYLYYAGYVDRDNPLFVMRAVSVVVFLLFVFLVLVLLADKKPQEKKVDHVTGSCPPADHG